MHPLYALERGEITETEFMQRTSDELPDGVELSELGQGYFTRLERNEPMLEFLAELRGRGLRLALCTNNVREWEPMWRPMMPRDRRAVRVGGGLGIRRALRKPEPEIYGIVLERLGLPGTECVFIDDVEDNCIAAAEAGMHPVHFRDAQQAIPRPGRCSAASPQPAPGGAGAAGGLVELRREVVVGADGERAGVAALGHQGHVEAAVPVGEDVRERAPVAVAAARGPR